MKEDLNHEFPVDVSNKNPSVNSIDEPACVCVCGGILKWITSQKSSRVKYPPHVMMLFCVMTAADKIAAVLNLFPQTRMIQSQISSRVP